MPVSPGMPIWIGPDGGPFTVVGSSNALPVSASYGSGNFVVVGPVVAGNPPSAGPVYIAGTDGTNLRALSTDTTGKLQIAGAGPVAPGTAAINSTLVGGQFNTTLPTLTNTQQAAMQLDASGRLIVAVQGPVAAGTVAANSVLGAGQYNTTIPALTNAQQVAQQCDVSGSTLVNSEGRKLSYSTSFSALAGVVGDTVVIGGSATKTVKITRIEFDGVATAAVTLIAQLIKRSTADTGGTSSALTIVPHDSNDAAASATAVSYSVAPTNGTSVGAVRGTRWNVPATGGNPDRVVWDFTRSGAKQPVLRGTAQQLAINLNATLGAGGVMDGSVEWTEE